MKRAPKRNIKATPEQVAELVAQKKTDLEIGAHFRLSKSHVGELRRRAGIILPPRSTLPEEIHVGVRERAAEGWPTREIMAEFHVSRDYIQTHAGEFTVENGKAYRRLITFAQRRHRELYDSIQRMDIS